MDRVFLIITLIPFILCCAGDPGESIPEQNYLNIPVEIQIENNPFWEHVADKNYPEAVNAAVEIAQSIPEYYMLAAVSSTLINDYTNFEIYRMKYRILNYGNYGDLEEIITENLNIAEDPDIIAFCGITAWEYNEFQNLDAENYIKQALEIENDNPYALNYISMIHYRNREYDKALEAALKCVEKIPGYSEAYNNAAIAYKAMNKIEQARDILKQCISVCDSPHINTYYNLIFTFGNNGITFSPGEKNTMDLVGSSFLKTSELDELYELLKESDEKFFDFITALINEYAYENAGYLIDKGENNNSKLPLLKAMIYFRQDNIESFLNEAELCLNENIYNYKDYYELGNYFYYLGNLKMARTFFYRAIDVLNQNDLLYGMRINSNMGVTYFIDNDMENGILFSETALKYNPYDSLTYYNVGYFYYKNDDFEDAEYYFLKAKEFAVNNSMISNIDTFLQNMGTEL